MVDSNSVDGSVAMVCNEFPEVNLIKSDINLGFAGANSLAYTHAQGDYIVVLNSDAFIKGEGLKKF